MTESDNKSTTTEPELTETSTLAVNIYEEIAKTQFLENRTRFTTDEEEESAFAMLPTYRGSGVFAGGFSGESAWERHPMGDELVQVLDGETDVIIATGSDTETLHLKKGSLIIVPKGKWHRFNALKGVTLMTITPEPTEISSLEHPPQVAM